MNHTQKNFTKLQTKCANCSHVEWDHYMHHEGSRTACDSGGCRCREFRAPTMSPLDDTSRFTIIGPRFDTPSFLAEGMKEMFRGAFGDEVADAMEASIPPPFGTLGLEK